MTRTPTFDERTRVLDFGTIVLEHVPLLAHVQVADDTGRGVPGATIETLSKQASDRLECDEHGRYRIAGPLSSLPLTARATCAGWVAGPWTPIVKGGSELTLVLQRGARLEGQLLLPGGARPEDLELRLRSASSGATATPIHDGRFRFEGLPAGRFALDVEFLGEGLRAPVELELVAGQTRVLPPIDLRDELHALELRFALASGEPWTQGHLETRRPDERIEHWVAIGPQATAVLASTRPTLDLWVGARGARPTRFEGVRDGDLLTLPAAPALRLRLPPEIGLPPAPLVLGVSGRRLRPENVPFEPDDDADVEEALARPDATVLFRRPWPGEYQLEWFVRNTLTEERFGIEVDTPQIVSVTESAVPASVPVRLARVALERALERAAAGE